MSKYRGVVLAAILVSGLLLSGCGTAVSVVATSPLTSPPSPVSTPQEENNAPSDVHRFELDKPLRVGDRRIVGTGPAGVPVMIVDVTLGGEVLGTAVVGDDGVLSVELNQGLQARHRVGLALGNLDGTDWVLTDLQSEKYYGDEALSVPQVGFFYDTFFIPD
mgnify:CR=1 FL=1